MNLFRRVALSLVLPLIILFGILSVQSIVQYRTGQSKNQQKDTIHAEIILERLDSLKREMSSAASLIVESRDSSRSVKEHDVDYLFDWTGLFHTDFLNRIIITDENGIVLTRSYDQFLFSDRFDGELPVTTSLAGGEFWGLIEFDGVLCLVFSRPVLLYGEFLVGTVSVCAELTDKLTEHLSDSHMVGVSIGDYPLDRANEENGKVVRANRQFPTNFHPSSEATDLLHLHFFQTEDNRKDFTNSIIIIALLFFVMLISLILVYQVLSNYVHPYSELVESFSLMARKEVDFEQLRQRLNQIKGGRNKEADRIASSFTELSYVLENDISDLEDSAHRDALTGLSNRRYCAKVFSWELKRHRNEEGTLSVIIADIDHFKIINDTFGHSCGDAVLIKVAEILKEICRGRDIPVRWGGEEFLVLCPFTDLDGCYTLAEKLRLQVEEHIVPFLQKTAMEVGVEIPQENLPIGTCSLGCAVVRDLSEGYPWYEAADKALYTAKRNGRNRVEPGYPENG